MFTLAMPQLTLKGEPIDEVELLDDCTPLLQDPDALREQFRTNGYVYLPGYLGRDRVMAGRRVLINELQRHGALHPDHDPMEGVLNPDAKAPGFTGGRLEDLFADYQAIHDVLYTGPMMAFFRTLFGGVDVLHYDFTWTRMVKPGPATDIHSDVVYMGRGTHDLYTAWTPFGDNGFDLGGLILLEGSNNHDGLAKSYWKSDVDAYCENTDDKRDGWQKGNGGALKGGANQIRRSLGGRRWLTGDYRMGDVVMFNVYTVHGGTDNHSNKVRLSTDTRYQRADQPVDERWVGERPVGHGPGGKRGLIC
jgi:hypothetical protein